MAKWADYLISAVRYNANETHIDSLRVHKDGESSIGAAEVMSRAQVIQLIKSGKTFITVFKNSEGKWTRGAPVKIIVVGGTEYIKTVADSTPRDNLENLPRF